MEEKFDKALANKIRALSEEHEQSYEIGAWENFESQAYGSGKNLFRFLWIGVAASFLMAMSVNTIYNSSNFDGVKKSASFSFKSIDGTKALVSDDLILQENKIESQKMVASTSSDSYVNLKKNTQEARFVHFNSENQSFIEGSMLSDGFLNSEVQINNHHYEGKRIKYFSGFIPYAYSENTKKERSDQRNVKVGIALTSGLNSIDFNKSGCSIGAGALADIPLFSGFALNTGLLFNAQRLNYSSETEGREVQMTGKLVSVDLPVNVKYAFCQKTDKQFFVSAGVSSLAYITENFKQEGQEEVSLAKDDNTFSGLDIAKFVNLSMGVEIPLEKQLSLLIEPYLKYPLGNTTSQEIKYASAGLSLRLNMGLALLN